MSRAIDSEKYMELLKEQYLHNQSMGNSQTARAWQGAIQLLYDMPTLTPTNEWVSVEERLPDSQADVLVVAFWHENWQTMIGWHSDTSKKWRVITPYGEMEPGGVTHWMPLPKSPKEDE